MRPPRPSRWRVRSVFAARSVRRAGLSDRVRLEDYSVFAGVLPEDKFNLVKTYQSAGHTVGMCGDGANDAPALRQAQIGIAVSTATDVAKSAAGMVLTAPGLAGVVSAVRQGRIIFQRILTYTLNSITKKIVQVLFIAAGLIMTGHAILTPLLMALIMIVGDILGMSLTTDNVRPSPHPKFLAHRQIDDCRLRHWAGSARVLCRCPCGRRLCRGLRHCDLENARLRDPRLRQPGDDLQQSRETPDLVVAAKFVAHRFLGCRHVDRLRPRRDGDRDGASIPPGGRGRARRRCRFRYF